MPEKPEKLESENVVAIREEEVEGSGEEIAESIYVVPILYIM